MKWLLVITIGLTSNKKLIDISFNFDSLDDAFQFIKTYQKSSESFCKFTLHTF